jgi:hypothetical protein
MLAAPHTLATFRMHLITDRYLCTFTCLAWVASSQGLVEIDEGCEDLLVGGVIGNGGGV